MTGDHSQPTGTLEAPMFSPTWSAAVGVGCSTSLAVRPTAISFSNYVYVFYTRQDTGELAAVAYSSAERNDLGGWVTVSLPALMVPESASAAVFNNQLYLAYVADQSVQLLSTTDGANWSTVTPQPDPQGCLYGVGLAAGNDGLYLTYVTGGRFVRCQWLDEHNNWYGPEPVANMTAYGSPALAFNGTTLVCVFETNGSGNISWASLPAGGTWTDEGQIGSDTTQGEVSLTTIEGGVMLGYWGTGNDPAQLYSRILPTGSNKWQGPQHMGDLKGNGPIALSNDPSGQPICAFPQLGALYLAYYMTGTWTMVWIVGGLESNVPPALGVFNGQLVAVTNNTHAVPGPPYGELMAFTSTDGITWSAPTYLYPYDWGIPARTLVAGQAVWLFFNTSEGVICLAAYNGQTWKNTNFLTPPNSGIGAPAVAAMGDVVYLAYQSTSATGSQVIAWMSYEDGTWSEASTITPSTNQPTAPSLAVSGNNLWLGFIDGETMYVQRYDSANQTWDAPSAIKGESAKEMTLTTFEGVLILLWLGTSSTSTWNAMWNTGTGWVGKKTFETVPMVPGAAVFGPTPEQTALWVYYRGEGNFVGLCCRTLTLTG